MSDLTQYELKLFYTSQKTDLFENGITTIFGNKFSGEFFQTFFKSISDRHAYFLIIHLSCKRGENRQKFKYTASPEATRQSVRKCSVFLNNNLTRSKDKANRPVQFEKYFTNQDNWRVHGSLFQLPAREVLEEFLLYLRDNCMSTLV
jgi:hypothetical protein